MQTKTKKALLGLAFSMMIGGMIANATAQEAPFALGPQHPLKAPLSPDSPYAKFDISKLNVAPAKPEKARKWQGGSMIQEVEYDLMGKTTTLGPIANRRVNLGEGFSAPGADGLIGDSESNYQNNRTIGAYSVIGADNRTKITATTTYPWRTQCKVLIRFPDGSNFVGSGTLIQSKYVITAGHCVYDSGHGGWATRLEVIPGLNGTYRPYGSAFATKMRTYTGWTGSASPDHDFALMTLDRNIGSSTGWLGYKSYGSPNGMTANIAGYPADRDSGLALYYHYGPINSSTSYRLFYQIDTFGGQSGSGIYTIESSGNRYVFGVHAYGASVQNGLTVNGGTRLDGTKTSSISSWIATGN